MRFLAALQRRVSLARWFRHTVIVAAITCFVTAAVIGRLIPIVFGEPVALLHITWAAIDDAGRQALEQRFSLTEGTARGERTWAYVPGDAGPETLRAIVSHPAVVATDGIDRRALRLSASVLSPRRGGLISPAWRGAPIARLVIYLLVAAGVALCALGVAGPARAALVLDRMPRNGRQLAEAVFAVFRRGIRPASPEAAGAFRIVFGTLTVLVVRSLPVDHSSLSSAAIADAQGMHHATVAWLATQPWLVAALDRGLLLSGLLFVAGVLTRASFAVFVALFYLWACIYTLATSHHTISALHVALICLLAARWGDAWSVDAGIRRLLGRPARLASARSYGFAIWVPGFVFGIMFLAAAWSKVHHGPGWILNGTVKYHFVSDLNDAMVTWGPWLTQWHAVAVVMSAAAIVTEAVLITASFSRSALYRLALGASAAALLTGFALFQGVLWTGWWVLLTSFLPWQAIGAAGRRVWQSDTRLPLAPVAVAVAVLVQQLFVSAAGAEIRPFLSSYDMYSATYASADEYEASTNLVYRVVVARRGASRELPECQIDDRTAARIRAAGAANDPRGARTLLGECLTSDADAPEVTLRGDRRVYRWDAGRFEWRRGVDVIGPVPIAPR